jgi:hypothetical protein
MDQGVRDLVTQRDLGAFTTKHPVAGRRKRGRCTSLLRSRSNEVANSNPASKTLPSLVRAQTAAPGAAPVTVGLLIDFPLPAGTPCPAKALEAAEVVFRRVIHRSQTR